MTRAQQTITIGLLVASIYSIALLGFLPLPQLVQVEIVPVLPFWGIVSFGAYLLFKLGFGVLTFNDVPEAHDELMKQIEQARTDLKKRGVTVD